MSALWEDQTRGQRASPGGAGVHACAISEGADRQVWPPARHLRRALMPICDQPVTHQCRQPDGVNTACATISSMHPCSDSVIHWARPPSHAALLLQQPRQPLPHALQYGRAKQLVIDECLRSQGKRQLQHGCVNKCNGGGYGAELSRSVSHPSRPPQVIPGSHHLAKTQNVAEWHHALRGGPWL